MFKGYNRWIKIVWEAIIKEDLIVLIVKSFGTWCYTRRDNILKHVKNCPEPGMIEVRFSNCDYIYKDWSKLDQFVVAKMWDKLTPNVLWTDLWSVTQLRTRSSHVCQYFEGWRVKHYISSISHICKSHSKGYKSY